ncbi:hypothetical protein Rifp1Sym_ac00210 [endosymbiont of Riftia pachyptila (vent Ph05)]|uniref:Uncharacterized protein n=1 Tax=endosymbiont of Riftia pachyptila (vent Ph05) TaxID=1048808 RepID=G2D9F0_9GAMM|nr:hypothetical protein Rifp1Sym_ac00210 [endosymbiont of Riftia pachyptila (vent Ph05)]
MRRCQVRSESDRLSIEILCINADPGSDRPAKARWQSQIGTDKDLCATIGSQYDGAFRIAAKVFQDGFVSAIRRSAMGEQKTYLCIWFPFNQQVGRFVEAACLGSASPKMPVACLRFNRDDGFSVALGDDPAKRERLYFSDNQRCTAVAVIACCDGVRAKSRDCENAQQQLDERLPVTKGAASVAGGVRGADRHRKAPVA